mmetsp:Transcript_10545/g.29798  ORF Transcript_10545/g.29798 Transcript_10545/m.29798 type:complete len:859 (+) Transcript_10545:55-2631(+)
MRVLFRSCLELILIVFRGWDNLLETLSLSGVEADLVRLGALVMWIRSHHLPMIEHRLWEGLSRGGSSQDTGETEGLDDWQVGLDVVDRGTRSLNLLEHNTSLLVQHRVDTTNGVLWTLDLDQVDRLHELWSGVKLGGVHNPPGGRDDLSTTSMDRIGVQDDILDLEGDTSHVLLGKRTVLGGPLQGGDDAILDLIQVLDSLGHINNHVWSSGVRSEAPNLPGTNILVPLELLGKVSSPGLRLVSWSNESLVNGLWESFLEWPGGHVYSVMLVGGLGHDGLLGRLGDSLPEGHDRIGDSDRGSSHEILLQILEANLQVKLTGTGDNVLTSVLDGALNHRIRLGQALETLHKLWKIRGGLALDGDTHDRGHGELHGLDRVGIRVLLVGQGGVLGDELIESDHGDGVTARDVLDGVLPPSHAQHGSLDGLDVQVLLLSRDVVWSHDPDLLASSDLTGEDTSEGEEPTLIGGRNHLGNVEHQWTVRVAVGDGGSVDVIRWSLVQGLDSVSLGDGWGWQVVDHHLQEGPVGWEPGLHDTLHEWLSVEVPVLGLEEVEDSQGGHLLEDVVLLSSHATVDDGLDRVVDELDEGPLAGSGPGVLLGPLLGLRIKEVVSPELAHHLLLGDSELLGVELSKGGEGEGPSVKTGREGDGSLVRVHLNLPELLVGVGGHDNVGVLDHAQEVGVRLLSLKHELQEAPVHLVDGQHRANPLTQRLPQHGLGLHADSLHAVHHNQSSVGDTQGRSHLGTEVNVTGRVDQVDKEIVPVPLSLESGEPLLLHLVVQRDSGRLDGDAPVLLVLPRVGKPLVTRVLHGDDSSSSNETIRQRTLPVVHVSDHTHVPNVVLLVHQGTDLINRELHHGGC